MKKINLILIMISVSLLSFAQIYSTTEEGNYDFVTTVSSIGVSFDYSEAEINGVLSMDKYTEGQYQNRLVIENEKKATKWKESWIESYTNANNEFILRLNDELGKKATLKFEKDANTEIHSVFKVSYLDMPKGEGSYATLSGKMFFYDAQGNVLAIESYDKIKGKEAAGGGKFGLYGNSTTAAVIGAAATAGDGYKLNTCLKNAATGLGRKLHNLYFSKK